MPFNLKNKFNLEFVLTFFIKAFLFLFPWQTIYIYREIFIGGFKSEYATLGFYATEGLLWVIMVLFMGWYVKKNKEQRIKNKFRLTSDRVFVLSVLLFISYLFISILWSRDTYLAWQQATRVMEAFVLFFILFLGPLDFKSAVKWLVMGAILPSVLGIWQFVSQSAPASSLLGLTGHAGWEGGASIISGDKLGRILRAYGTFGHPNVFGGYLAIVIVLWLSLRGGACATTKQSPGNLEKIKNINLPGIASSADASRLPRNDIFIYFLFLTTLFLTFSRSALLAIAMVILLNGYMVVRERRKLKNEITQPFNHLAILPSVKFIIYLLSPFIILSIIFSPILSVRMSNESIYETRSINERITGYGEAWQIIKANPILGVGAGNYTVALWRLDKWRPVWEIQPVHNVFLLFIAELGLVGVVLLLFVVISFINLKNKEKRLKIKTIVIILYSLFFILLAMFDHYLYSSYVGLALTAVFFGLLAKSSTQDLHS